MPINPLQERGIPLDRQLRNWSELNVQPYDKETVHPYSRCRGIVANGVEVEAMFFSHNMARNTLDPDIRRHLAAVRRIESQQQRAVNWLIPGDETTLEVTLGYEQVAVDLTARLAQTEPDPYLRQVYEFALLEDFDHLYLYSNLYELLQGQKAERITGQFTEIMPGRPTVFEHRDPNDEIRRPMTALAADPKSILNAMMLVASEQQTMNFYNTIGNRYQEPIARALYSEIAEIEQQHVSHYESILDPTCTWIENLLFHELLEVWMYYSFMEDEPDPRVRALYELHLNMELTHLQLAADLMRTVERRDPEALLPAMIEPDLKFHENKQYLRSVLARQVELTANKSDFVPLADLPEEHRYFDYQRVVNKGGAPSDAVVQHARNNGGEYRLETEGPHPVQALRREEEQEGADLIYERRAGRSQGGRDAFPR